MRPEGRARPGSRSGARAARDAAPHWCRGPPGAAAPGLMRDGTGSRSWWCRHGDIRVVAGPGVRAAAMMGRDAARPERGRPRPHTRPTAQAGRRACRPARSAFFRRRIGIADAHHAVLALAHHHAGLAPGAALLPTQAGLVQGAPDRERADLWQPIRSLAQSFLQQAQGPSRRAVLVALWGSRPFRQDALLRVTAIADPRATSVTRPHGREPVAVEPADPGRARLGLPSSDLVGRRPGGVALADGQQGSGALDLGGGRAERAAQADQLLALIRRERAKGIV